MKRLISPLFLCLILVVPSPLFPVDRRFLARVAATALADAADIALTQRVWKSRPWYHEADPIFGARQPGALRMAAIDLPFLTGINLLSLKLRHSHSRLSWAPQSVSLAESAWGIAQNIRALSSPACHTLCPMTGAPSLGPRPVPPTP
jgi:hypothetical protein